MVEMIEKHINLKTRGLPIRIDVVQGTNAIPIKFTLTDYDIPVGAEARIYVRKPSNTEVYNNCTIDNNSVIVQPTTQMYAEVGRLKAQIQLIAGDGVAASFVFCIDVAENLVSSSAVESCNEFGILDTLINEAREMIATLGGLKPHAFAAPIQNLATTVAGSALDATMGKKLQDGIDTLNSSLSGKINNRMTLLPDRSDPRVEAKTVGFYTVYNPSSPAISGWFNFVVFQSSNNPAFRQIIGATGTTLLYSGENNGTWSDWSTFQNIGLLSDLKTINKNSVVEAMNELYTKTAYNYGWEANPYVKITIDTTGQITQDKTALMINGLCNSIIVNTTIRFGAKDYTIKNFGDSAIKVESFNVIGKEYTIVLYLNSSYGRVKIESIHNITSVTGTTV